MWVDQQQQQRRRHTITRGAVPSLRVSTTSAEGIQGLGTRADGSADAFAVGTRRPVKRSGNMGTGTGAEGARLEERIPHSLQMI